MRKEVVVPLKKDHLATLVSEDSDNEDRGGGTPEESCGSAKGSFAEEFVHMLRLPG